MPILSGVEVVELLKKNPNPLISEIPVVMTSGSQDSNQRGLAAGANDSFVKPFTIQDISQFFEEFNIDHIKRKPRLRRNI